MNQNKMKIEYIFFLCVILFSNKSSFQNFQIKSIILIIILHAKIRKKKKKRKCKIKFYNLFLEKSKLNIHIQRVI